MTHELVTLDITITEQPEAVALDEEDEEEQAAGRPPHEYVGTVMIAGVPHHITLFAIERNEDGNPFCTTSYTQPFLDGLTEFEREYDFRGLHLGEQEYLCAITPYAQ